MENQQKTVLPKPDFSKKSTLPPQSVLLTPSGMTLLPRKHYKPIFQATSVKNQEKNRVEEKAEERHFCEPCEMQFPLVDLKRHRSQHEKCPVDGCKFKAHPSVMDKHVTELHSSGIFEKIQKVSTPEEIAAWREERKKKFPTLANTLLRKLAQEQRQKRGERLEGNKSRFGHKEDRKRTRNVENLALQQPSNPQENPSNERSSRFNKTKNQEQKTSESNNRFKDKRKVIKKIKPKKCLSKENVEDTINKEADSSGMRMFEGTSKLKDYQHEENRNQQTKNVLSSFLGMYGSDDDENYSNDEEENEKSVGHISESGTMETVKAVNEAKSQSSHKPESLDRPCSSSECIESVNQPLNGHETNETFEGPLNKDINKNFSSDAKIENDPTSDLSDEGPEELPIERTTTTPKTIENTSVSTNELDMKSSSLKRTRVEDSQKDLQFKRKYGLDYKKMRLRKQNTMLEKLLEPEIRHERNVLLQCVRFVVQNNFFGIGSKNPVSKSMDSS